MNIRPVFIAGCDRSGTTMLGNILGAAPEAAAIPESQFIHELLMLLHLRAFDTTLAAAKWLKNHFRFAVWELQQNEEELACLIDLEGPRHTVENLISAYLDQNLESDKTPEIWIDHTPDTFKHYAIVAHYFPEARFIHIVRDGRAVFNSIKDLDWGPNNAYMGTRFWAERLQQALTAEIAAGEKCVRIRYEDILNFPEQLIAEVCDFCQLKYEDTMLTGKGLRLPAFTLAQHYLVGQRPDSSRINQWRAELRAREVSEFEAYPWSRTLLLSMGYELETVVAVKIPMAIILWRYLHNQLAYFINRLKHRQLEKVTLQRSVPI